MFLAGRKPHGIYDVFLPLVAKITVFIYSVFWPAPSKNTGIYAVFTMLQDVVSISEKDKHTVNYSVLGLLLGCTEMTSLLNNQVTGLVALPFTS